MPPLMIYTLTRDDIPLLSQWIKKSTCRNKSIFWRREGDTLRPHRFDRSERLPKRFVVLETSQSQKAIAPFGLLRRTSSQKRRVQIYKTLSTKTKNQSYWIGFCFGGSGWIRTTEVRDNRFTVCPLWPLGNTPIFNYKKMELVDGLEPPTC